MNIQIFGTKKCNDTKKAERFFKERGIKYTSGLLYKDMKLKDKLPTMSEDEQVAGFKDKQTGHFTEVMLIRDGLDLDKFMKMYDLSSVSKEY